MEETMRNKVVATMALVLLLALAACAKAPTVDWNLKVSGAVSSPLTLSYAALAGMKQTELGDILMEKSTGEDAVGSWSGVSLDEILSKAGAGELASITAVAGDGYAIEVSKDELQGGIVALKDNGKWIAEVDADHGPIRLVTPNTPANRWVFQLQEIQVNEQASGSIPANAALKVTGSVETEVGWTDEKIRSMDTISADYTDKSGETKTSTGVAINDFLGKAGPKSDATTVVLVADDGYTAELTLAEVQACADCIVAFDEPGFRSVMPNLSGKAQVKGLIEIQVR
jgi:DMSO/TMAO reductase YedYZ molybdopterin-dependent catalytic subunit